MAEKEVEGPSDVVRTEANQAGDGSAQGLEGLGITLAAEKAISEAIAKAFAEHKLDASLPRFTFNGLRSHLKAKCGPVLLASVSSVTDILIHRHDIEDVRDEDYFDKEPPTDTQN